MHITVQFIGDADADDVREALASVDCARFRLSVHGVGRFRLNGGRTILWAGVTESEALLELHGACGRALTDIGIALERRRYQPHVTLARLRAFADKSVIRAFLDAGENRDFGSFVADRFILYNSTNSDDGARYESVASWPLR